MNPSKVIIGTRGSDLALWQANEAARLIGAETRQKIIKTSGDRFLDISLQGQLEKGFFTKEIEEQLLACEIDVAVHSLKDLPTASTPGLTLGAYLKRAPVSDLLIINPDWHDPGQLIPLKKGCKVGATSLRRQALLKLYGPQCSATMLRGNVPNRVRKCSEGEYGAIILARAGVSRLGLEMGGLVVYEISPELWLPAPGQGAVAIQARADDSRVLSLLSQLDDAPTRQAACLERQLLANFEGGCHTAFGSWAKSRGDGEWELLVGMELEQGWGQCAMKGEYEKLEALGPDSGLSFKPSIVQAQEELCLKVQL